MNTDEAAQDKQINEAKAELTRLVAALQSGAPNASEADMIAAQVRLSKLKKARWKDRPNDMPDPAG